MAPAGKSPDLSRLKVLAVDDNRHMTAILKAILQGFRINNFIEVREPTKAFATFNEFSPDIILLDYLMKPVDGLQIAKLIRTSAKSANPYVPIIMITGYASPEILGAARQAGVNEFLVKPISPTDLYNRMISVIFHPRPFVRTANYFGPDRRRHRKDEFFGTDRRTESPAFTAAGNGQLQRAGAGKS